MQTVLAVRHGETSWNRESRLQGWAAVGLSDRGRDQAQDLADRLSREWSVDRFVASDLERARETATILAESTAIPDPTFHQAFRERDIGRYQGFTKEALRGEHDQTRLTAVDFVPPGGESLQTMDERLRTGLRDRLDRLSPDGTLLVVTHGGPIRALLGAAHDHDLQTALDTHDPANCSVTPIALEAANLETAQLLSASRP